jgi:predicted metal-dependent hydrolase
MISQKLADQIYTIIDTELRNVRAPIPSNNKKQITEFLQEHINVLPQQLVKLLETLSERSFAMHMAFNKLFNAKNKPMPNTAEMESNEISFHEQVNIAETNFHDAVNKLSKTIELCQSYRIEVESDIVIIPELQLDAHDYSTEGVRDVPTQINVIDLHIQHLQQQKERLVNAEESPNALICYEYDTNSPSVIYVGDTISTKFGCGIVVTAVDKEKSRFSFVNDSNEIETLCSSRFSGVEKYTELDS